MFSEKFLIVCSASSSRSLMKIVEGLSIDPWDTRLVTSIQLDDDDGQSSAFGSARSSSFQPSSLSAHLSHTTTARLGGSYGRQCQRPSWSPSRQYPHSPHPAGQPFHCELSGWSSMTSLFVNPCWLLLIVFLSFICLEIFSWISWYVLAKVQMWYEVIMGQEIRTAMTKISFLLSYPQHRMIFLQDIFALFKWAIDFDDIYPHLHLLHV